ncbi:MAG: hemolysin III family protein [Thermoanaerobaculum sp.]|nr:hemolysin III family protein [Thermoanaerobaculum sp.]
MTESPSYSGREEAVHSLIHGLGVVLAIAALAVLVGFAARFGGTRHILSASVFGASLVLAYAASTIYHVIPPFFPRLKRIMRMVDHAMIFVLIAGTYTPFCLVTLQGPWGNGLLLVVWLLAALGIVYETTLLGRFKVFSVLLYLSLGWLVVVVAKPLVAAIPWGGLVLLVAGGLAYTVGVAFYAAKPLPFHHAVWHGFVLLGSTLHFFAVLLYVMRPPQH